MSFGPSELANQSPFVVRAELALKDLKDRVTAHIHRESQIRRIYAEWQENLLSQTDQLRRHVAELEARLAPWIPRGDSLRLAVVSRTDDNN
jgi:hypothetical protein